MDSTEKKAHKAYAKEQEAKASALIEKIRSMELHRAPAEEFVEEYLKTVSLKEAAQIIVALGFMKTRKAIDMRHKESRADKDRFLEWFEKNRDKYSKNEAAKHAAETGDYSVEKKQLREWLKGV